MWHHHSPPCHQTAHELGTGDLPRSHCHGEGRRRDGRSGAGKKEGWKGEGEGNLKWRRWWKVEEEWEWKVEEVEEVGVRGEGKMVEGGGGGSERGREDGGGDSNQ